MNELIKEIEKRIHAYHDEEFEKDLLDWVAEHYPICEVYPVDNWRITKRIAEIEKILKGEK